MKTMTALEVKKTRKVLRVTQAGLADLIGVARNTVARWEMGLHPVSPPIERLLKALASSRPAAKTHRPRRRNG